MLETKQNIFIVGIKGVAMANLAIILKQMGKQVSGCDVEEEFITDATLREYDIRCIHSFNPDDVPVDTELIVYSGGHQGMNNPMIQEGLKRGIVIKTQIEVLSEIMDRYKTRISICGSHGKTTTTAFLAYVLKQLHAEPGYMVGTSTFNELVGGEKGNGDYFIMESDEYGVSPPENKMPKFHLLNPNYILATTIDFDHPDIYADIHETKTAFFTFFQKVAEEEHRLLVCADDKNLKEVVTFLPRVSYKTFGYDESSDIRIQNVKVDTATSFDLYDNGKKIDTFTISLFGEKNVSNTAGAIALLLTLGFTSNDIKQVVEGFTGSKRRFEQISHENSIYLFDDYAHHPNEIKATINAARSRFKTNRVIVIFQPHTYSRTAALKDEFIDALANADEAYIAPIFASAREKQGENPITSQQLQQYAYEKGMTNIHTFMTPDELFKELQDKITAGDVLFTMGAGDIYKLKNDIIRLIKSV